MKKALLAAFAACMIVAPGKADDWPQFRGPDRTGMSGEKGLLKEWPKGGPKLAWTFKDAGLGFSSVAVAKGVVYTLGTDKEFIDEYVIAIDEKSGKELWRAKIGPLYVDLQKDKNGKQDGKEQKATDEKTSGNGNGNDSSDADDAPTGILVLKVFGYNTHDNSRMRHNLEEALQVNLNTAVNVSSARAACKKKRTALAGAK